MQVPASEVSTLRGGHADEFKINSRGYWTDDVGNFVDGLRTFVLWRRFVMGSSSANAVSTSGKSDNGSVSADKSTAKKGDTVAITVTPDAGYELGKLTVTDSKGNGSTPSPCRTAR